METTPSYHGGAEAVFSVVALSWEPASPAERSLRRVEFGPRAEQAGAARGRVALRVLSCRWWACSAIAVGQIETLSRCLGA
jgi:hypothetical protein